MPEEKINGLPKWEVENAADTLRRAYEIAGKPKLFKAAKKQLLMMKKATDKALNWAEKMK